MSNDTNNQIIICRECHTIYKKKSQKFCGNDCQNKPPFFINGKKNLQIEPRVIILEKNENNTIRWICVNCKKEYSDEDLKNIDNLCNCGVKNDFFPFTFKECATIECKNEGNNHILPLEAKNCELCGKNNFILNKNKNSAEFINQKKKKEVKKQVKWVLEDYHFKDLEKKEKKKNAISVSFTLLNNNMQCILFAEGRSISSYDIIREAKGYFPDIMYKKFIEKYSINAEIFKILYKSENEQFFLKSIMDLDEFELDTQFKPIRSAISHKSDNEFVLTEGKLLELRSNYFRIHIWVY